jgi:bifunctional UDP-N-acetylglucosamine pyrophosphorylase/glucosamine-1-phosphate N-acetyltransferase
VTYRKAAVILAAGEGKRMKSDLPKVLHRINDRPMVQILLDTLVPLDFERIVVVIGHKGEMVKEHLREYPVQFVWQREQLGTAHAVMMARDHLADFGGVTLVAAGDVPFLSADSVNELFATHLRTGSSATCLSADFKDPAGYGRIIRDGDSDFLKDIVEHKDASEDILRIHEINSSTYCFDNMALFETITQIDNRNIQGEYYLTDAVKIMHNRGLKVAVVKVKDADEVTGVNSVAQLEALQRRISGYHS